MNGSSPAILGRRASMCKPWKPEGNDEFGEMERRGLCLEQRAWNLRRDWRKSVMSSLGMAFAVPSHTHQKATGGFKLRRARSSFSLREGRVKGAWPGITLRKRETTTKARVRSI